VARDDDFPQTLQIRVFKARREEFTRVQCVCANRGTFSASPFPAFVFLPDREIDHLARPRP